MLNCIGCEIAAGKSNHPFHKIIVNLEGGWLLNHSNESRSYLGHLIITTREHRADWNELTPAEASTLGMNMQHVEAMLKQYWALTWNDPLERLYVCYFNDSILTKIHHFHMHLFPRTKSMLKGISWEIVDIQETPAFNPDYRIHNGKDFINTESVNNLMEYLAKAQKSLDAGYSSEFKSWFVNQYGIPVKNFRSYL